MPVVRSAESRQVMLWQLGRLCPVPFLSIYDRARYESRGRVAGLFVPGFMLFELYFQQSCILRLRR
jgi:hypothetical protein